MDFGIAFIKKPLLTTDLKPGQPLSDRVKPHLTAVGKIVVDMTTSGTY